MEKKAVSGILLTLLLISMLTLAFNIQLVKATGTIYIRADGSIDPPDAPIQRNADLYTLTNNITSDADGIVIERNNMILDGDGYTIQGIGAKDYIGVDLSGRKNVTIRNLKIELFFLGIYLCDSSNSSIIGNNITGSSSNGISLCLDSMHNTVSGNSITANNDDGISLFGCSNNCLNGNNITANGNHGIRLSESSNNVVKDNIMVNNRYNFGVYASFYSHLTNEVATSNIVDGKRVYYWVDRRNLTIPDDAGYVALINCTCITVQNLNLTKNGQGLLLARTTETTATKNNVANNYNGVWFLQNSLNNRIIGNNLTNNNDGVLFWQSSGNSIVGNNITHNICGIRFYWSPNNFVYHNSFIDNKDQVFIENSINIWDNGYPDGGNYWSDYKERYPNATELDDSGLWEVPYVIDAKNQDNYPIIPECPSFLILLLFMLATLLAVAVYRKKQ